VTDGHEKRKSSRVHLDTVVNYSLDGKRWRETKAQDLSVTGMLLRSRDVIEPGQTITLTFQIPNLRFQDPIQVEAEVMRVVKRQHTITGLGLRFVNLRAGQFDSVKEFVDRVQDLPLSEGSDGVVLKGGRAHSRFLADRLAREVEEREVEKLERKMARSSPSRRQVIYKYARLGLPAGLILFGLYILYEISFWFFKLYSKVNVIKP